jgi:galactonate dehydratase
MKISSIRTVVVNAVMRNWVFVKVETDQPGLRGWGEASLNWKTRAVAATLQDLEPLLIGRDPRDIEQCVRALTRQSYYRLGIIGTTAISGIEHALWDIFGKSLGLPVWRLLGGRTRDRVRLYTHLGLGEMQAVYETFDPGRLATGLWPWSTRDTRRSRSCSSPTATTPQAGPRSVTSDA